MLKRMAALALAGAMLAGCTEVTRFQERTGGAVYMVKCGDGLGLLDTCRRAMARTCPGGYQLVRQPVAAPAGNRPAKGVVLFRCGGNPG